MGSWASTSLLKTGGKSLELKTKTRAPVSCSGNGVMRCERVPTSEVVQRDGERAWQLKNSFLPSSDSFHAFPNFFLFTKRHAKMASVKPEQEYASSVVF